MRERRLQYVLLGVGLVAAVAGGVLKAMAVAKEPEIFSYILFSGDDYLLLMEGLLLVVLAMGHDRLFGPESPEGPEEQR